MRPCYFILILTAIDIIIPDPLPYIDEIIFLIWTYACSVKEREFVVTALNTGLLVFEIMIPIP